MTYYAALDVSLRPVAICIIDDGGTVCLERTVPSEVADIVACLRGFDHAVEVVGFEAGTLSQYLTHGLQADGFDVVCLEARQVNAALSAMRNKTDRNDARGIAQILRTGWYARVHVKSRASHYIRALLSSRKAVLRKCIDLENEIRGLFKVFGVKLPASLGHGPFDARVRAPIENDPALAEALLPLLDVRLVLYRSYLELDRRVKRLARNDAVCQRLMTVPGVGPVTAMTFKAPEARRHHASYVDGRFKVPMGKGGCRRITPITNTVLDRHRIVPAWTMVWMKPKMSAAPLSKARLLARLSKPFRPMLAAPHLRTPTA